MYTVTQAAFIIAVYKLADFKQWKDFHPTLLYVCVLNLLYNYITANYQLWKLHPDFFSNHSITDIMNSIILLPAMSFLFLSHYPKNKEKKAIILYYIKWIIGSVLIESIFVVTNRISFHNGYHFWMEPFFYTLMFTFIRLHYKRPLLTYVLSCLVVLFFIWYFNVPIGTPIDERN
ncbi:CBO0543 family protein [Bacillus weihaiensis]|uniref:CBO0543 family protein n=1 Tax=Bacillus weihaiensis TaxID=1547283 RepID=UPI00235269D9|nr:CBO0543 family protein [Bacillus weihaiensis]